MLLEAGKSYAVTTAREEAKQAARYVLEKPGPDSVLNVLKMIWSYKRKKNKEWSTFNFVIPLEKSLIL